MAQRTKQFLLVDDDPLNNYLTTMILKKSFEGILVNAFTDPEEALEFIKSGRYNTSSEGKTTLFLDINMPTLSGWEFLEAFQLFDASIKEHYNIYILSSSVNFSDINFAKEHPLVLDFIEKPIKKVNLLNMFV